MGVVARVDLHVGLYAPVRASTTTRLPVGLVLSVDLSLDIIVRPVSIARGPLNTRTVAYMQCYSTVVQSEREMGALMGLLLHCTVVS